MTPQRAPDNERYRYRAEELRTLAETMRSDECARQLRGLAADYERMAERREAAGHLSPAPGDRP